MKTMLAIIIVAILGIVGYTIYSIRTVTHDPNVWHVDPLTAEAQPTPNGYYVGPPEQSRQDVGEAAKIYDASAIVLARAFDSFVMGQPLVERVAGSVEEGWLTYVQRTERMQFPDYISVRFFDIVTEQPPAEPVANDATPPVDGEVSEDGTEVAEVAPPPPPQAKSTIAIFSRSRYGHSDMGVNEARVESWLKALESFES